MEVLQTIEEYKEQMTKFPHLSERDQMCMDLLYRYCNQIDPYLTVEELDDKFFEGFFLYWFPKINKWISNENIYHLLPSVQKYCGYIMTKYKIPNLNAGYSQQAFVQEFLRISRLSKEFAQFLGSVIVGFDPLIIDFTNYKRNKNKKKRKEKNDILEQGYFQVLEISQDGAVTIKKKPTGRYAKILLDTVLTNDMRRGDILHLRMKRKFYFSYWELEEMKTCYLPEATKYLERKEMRQGR